MENFALIISVSREQGDLRFPIIEKLEELNFNLGDKFIDQKGEDSRLGSLIRFTAQPF